MTDTADAADAAPPESPGQLHQELLMPEPGGAASRAAHEILPIPMPDGTILRADVVRPDDDAAHPVLLTRCPYFGSWRPMIAQDLGEDPAAPGLTAACLGMQTAVGLDRAVEEGFAVVAQACRGTDISDGVAARRALADLPWCDGRVITFGNSYLTTTQFTAALASTEHLAAMTAWVAPSTYDEDLAMRGGVLMAGPVYEWARQQVRAGLARDGREDAPQELLPEPMEDFTPFLARVGMAEAARRLARAHTAGGHVADWLAHPLHDAHWESLAYPWRALAALDVPALHVAGWYDLFLGGTLRNYRAMADGPAGAGQRLVIGPWTHLAFDGHLAGRSFPGGGTRESGLGELTDGEAAARLPRDPVRVYIMGTGRWIDLPAWPAPDAEETAWRLADGGALLAPDEAGAAVGATSWTHDPADPVPTQGGQMLMGPPESAGPHDQRDVEARDDVAVFTGPPLAEPVTVLGPVRLRGTDRRDPLTPGVAVEVEVDMWATGVHVPAGHRLRLDLAGSCWPRYDVADPAGGAPVEITVHHDAARPSALLLPLVDLAALGRDRS